VAYKPSRLTVADGGTGQATLTDGGILVGNTASGITQLSVGVNNSLMVGATASDPSMTTTGTIYVTGIVLSAGTTLNSYVAGTFTPVIANSGSAPTLTYTTQVGRYTKIGDRVFCNINVLLATYAAGTGNVTITGLPFTTQTTTNNTHTNSIGLQNVTYGASVLWYIASILPNTTQIAIIGARSATNTLSLAAAGPGATGRFLTSIIFET